MIYAETYFDKAVDDALEEMSRKENKTMLHIKFEYMDAYSNGKWNRQECYVSSVAECKKIYGLDAGDCEYRIVSVEEVKG